MYGLQDILSPKLLTEAYSAAAAINATPNPFFEFYVSGEGERFDGLVEMTKFADTRQVAPINPSGAPAKTIKPQGAERVFFAPINIFNEIQLDADAIEPLRDPNSVVLQNRSMMEIRRQFEQFGYQHRLTKVVTLAKALADGIVYFDADGMVLESSSGAATTVDLGVAASHKTQLNHTSAGGDIIGTAWDNPAASILTDLEQIREAAEYDKAPIPRHVWMHSIAKPWILTNTEIKAFVQSTNPQADLYLRTLAGASDSISIGDWTFHFGNWTYVGADKSTVRPLIPKTKAIITPDPGPWFLNASCATTVPTADGVFQTVEDYMANTTRIYGDFAYTRINDNPVSLAIRLGCKFLYAFRDPNAVWMPTVDF